MKPHQLLSLGLLAVLFAVAGARADPLTTLQVLRTGGCGGILPAARTLHHDSALDRAAAKWAAGSTLQSAVEQSGFRAQSTAALHLTGPDAALMQQLRQSRCQNISERALSDVGLYQRGADTWLILAAAYAVPSRSQVPALAARTLQLVNAARQSGATCGSRSFAPAPPLSSSAVLADVALGHAVDMASQGYFEHEDPSGHTPADRVRAVGYKEKLVGENIAYGPSTADEVVKGWMDSPGHCENMMDPRFAEMGVAFAAGKNPQPGLYWVQVLAAPLSRP